MVKDSREWLIAGRSYTSQTIVDLESGREYEPPEEAYDGGGFCWASVVLSPDGNTLAVDGCYWGCPYEYRFFDFSDPAAGWPELPIEAGGYVDVVDARGARWQSDGSIACDGTKGDELLARTRLRREATTTQIVERWVSEAERDRRDSAEKEIAERDAWATGFREEDPLRQQVAVSLREHGIDLPPVHASPSKVTIYFRRSSPAASADLVWNPQQGPITLQLYENGAESRRIELDQSVDGMVDAVRIIAEAFAP